VNPIDLIRTTHEIDRGLIQISAAVADETLKRRLATLHAEWREIGFAVTAELCGVDVNGTPVQRRRGRPRRVATEGQAQPTEDA
jgi:hypothetical protein